MQKQAEGRLLSLRLVADKLFIASSDKRLQRVVTVLDNEFSLSFPNFSLLRLYTYSQEIFEKKA